MARTCYYELLGVERSATDSDLKRAYRQQALIWHPDKNHGNADEATRIFAEIKEAYETLSDPQERTWYDNHREQILRDDDLAAGGAASSEAASQTANVSFMPTATLMRFFSVASFRGFDDSPAGFFAVYRDLFEKLRDEELEVYDPDTEDGLDVVRNLDFGNAHTLYDEDEAHARGAGRASQRAGSTGTTLRDFYNYWTTFSSRKSFGWFDRYRLADADNRQIRRLMEKENRRLRDKAKREFVETVQNLAAWVKKRDPRYKRYVEERQLQQRAREDDRRRRVAEQRAAIVDGASSYIRQEWEEVDYTSVLDEFLSDGSASEDEDIATEDAGGECGPEDDLFCAACDKEFKTPAQKANHEQSKKHQKAVRQIRREMLREERQLAREQGASRVAEPASDAGSSCDRSGPGTDTEAEDDVLAQLVRELAMAQAAQSKKGKKGKRQRAPPADLPPDAPGLDHAAAAAATPDADDAQPEDPAPRAPAPTKRALRQERQKARDAAAAAGDVCCNVCGKSFASRNQLFGHIGDTGHALATRLPKHVSDQIKQRQAAKGSKGAGR